MTRSGLRAEELREHGGPGAGRPPGEQAAREPDRVDDRPGQSGSRETLGLAVEEREVEAGVVSHEDGIAGELEKAPDGDARMSLAAQLRIVETGESADRGRERYAGIDEQLEILLKLEPAHSHRADLADMGAARPQAGRLQIDDDEGGILELDIGAGRVSQPNRVTAPGEPGILADHLVQQAAGKAHGCVADGEEPPGRLLGEDGPAPLLDELHEPVRRIEPELHSRQPKRTYVRWQDQSRPSDCPWDLTEAGGSKG